jgi:hypothetical protein
MREARLILGQGERPSAVFTSSVALAALEARQTRACAA